MAYYGDRTAGDRVDFDVTFVDTFGVPTAVTSGSAFCRRLSTNTKAPAGVLFTSSGGLVLVTVFTASSASFYATADDYSVVMGTGTVAGLSVVDYTLGQFSIQNRGVNVARWLTATPNSLISGRVDANAAAVTVSANVLTWIGSTPNALISGRVDANSAAVTVSAAVLSIAAGAITSTAFGAGAVDAAAIAANAIGSSEFATTAQNAVADAVLLRDLATGASATDRNVQNALRALRNKTSISGTTLTVTQEDDSTAAWTATITTSSGLSPISAVDPA